MNAHEPLPRSPLLMHAEDTGLLVVDVQEKLVPLIQDSAAMLRKLAKLIRGAQILGVRVLATEQYPRGLGPTVAEIALPEIDVPAKTRFSCGECSALFHSLPAEGIRKLLICGMETHVCVQQTALDLMTAGFEIYVAVDAVGARETLDHDYGLRRMEASGVTLTTVEAALFEWCVDAQTPGFKSLSQLIREP